MVVRAVVFTRQQLCCPSTAVLFGQLLLQQGGAIQFWMLPSIPENSSRIHLLPHFGRLACRPTPALSFCAFSDVCWVLVAPLRGWFVTSLPLSAFMPLLISAGSWWLLWELVAPPCSRPLLLCAWATESLTLRVQLLAPSLFPREGSAFHPYLHCQCYSLLFMFSSFSWGEVSVCPGPALDYFLGRE
jgi:hypothetical protein